MSTVTLTSAAGMASRAEPIAPSRWQLSVRTAFGLEISILILLLSSSSAPTPLYSIYQHEWGFSPISTTVVFGVYAIAVLLALLVVGKLSDHIGRRPVLLAALAIQVVALIVFLVAGNVEELGLARVIQGLSTGAAVGALGAGLLDIDPVKGTVANGVAPVTGTATGALISGFFLQYLPAPTHLIFFVLIGLFVVQAVGVALMTETSAPNAGALRSLLPEIALPASARRPMIAAAPALVAVWALAGFDAALGPVLVRMLSGSDSYVLSGLPLFVLAGTAGITIYAVRHFDPLAVMRFGSIALVVGTAIVLVAIREDLTGAFFVGTAIAGIGFGAGFQGGIRTVLPLTHPHERAGVLSAIYIVSYLALGVPAVIAGFLVVHGGGVIDTAQQYAIVVMVLGILALVASRRSPQVTA